MPDRPKILAVTSELPWPLDTGGKLRTFHIQKALAAAADLRLLAPVQSHQGSDIDTLATQGITIAAATVGPRTRFAEARRFPNAHASRQPYVMFGRHARREVFAAVRQEFKQSRPGVMWLDHVDSLLSEPMASANAVPTVIDLHNVYSLILDRLAKETANPLKKWFLHGEAWRMQRMERQAAERCGVLLSVSEAEAVYYRDLGAKDVRVVPNGVDCGAFAHLPVGRTTTPLTILFVGTLSWGPNVSAALSLANEIFPVIQTRLPDAKLLLVGKDPAAVIQALAAKPGVTVAGSVPSIVPYLGQASLLAVPLDSGGGTRLKILEAFAAGLPVVSTAVGAEGIDATPGEHILIAERDAMAETIVTCTAKPELMKGIAEHAKKLAAAKYDWQRIGRMCVDIVRELTPRSPGDSARPPSPV